MNNIPGPDNFSGKVTYFYTQERNPILHKLFQTKEDISALHLVYKASTIFLTKPDKTEQLI